MGSTGPGPGPAPKRRAPKKGGGTGPASGPQGPAQASATLAPSALHCSRTAAYLSSATASVILPAARASSIAAYWSPHTALMAAAAAAHLEAAGSEGPPAPMPIQRPSPPQAPFSSASRSRISRISRLLHTWWVRNTNIRNSEQNFQPRCTRKSAARMPARCGHMITPTCIALSSGEVAVVVVGVGTVLVATAWGLVLVSYSTPLTAVYPAGAMLLVLVRASRRTRSACVCKSEERRGGKRR
mmetsp:Transcript_30583/g.76036  ORF Transcript_30583/g.76036 Transcript_30583/m.76036 type:complete len:242 (-) Transcript_30583:24-749(-)